MQETSLPLRPAQHAERSLLTAILDGTYAAGTPLPAERELAEKVGVTRPTLREALQRLQRDGWLEVRHGQNTRVTDFWHEGGLSALSALVRHGQLPTGFVSHLLEVREALAPAYACAAVARDPRAVGMALAGAAALADDPAAFAAFDWGLHRALARASSNPIHGMILNGFAGFYEQMAVAYFADPAARLQSRAFYAALLRAALRQAAPAAERLTRRAMHESAERWRALQKAPRRTRRAVVAQ